MPKVILCLLFVVVSIVPLLAHAHTLESDGDIGAILHIEPDDDPIIRQPSTLHFDISDRTNKFNAQRCECVLKVTKGLEEVASISLQAPLRTKLQTAYTFPEAGVYSLRLTGSSKDENLFSPFSLSYDLRVTRNDSGTTDEWSKFLLTHGIHVILFGGAFAVVFGLYLRNTHRQRKARKQSGV